MTKKLSLLFLICILSALSINAEIYEGSCGISGDNIKYSLDTETGVLKITGTGVMKDFERYGSNLSPFSRYQSNIKTVEISNGITSLGKYAFYNFVWLSSVVIGDDVSTIETGVFYGCQRIESINLPNSLTCIGDYAFYNCSKITSITFGDKLTTIGRYSFYGCTGLTTIDIPDNVTSIGMYAFYNCSEIASVTLSNSLTTINAYTFYGCKKLASINIPNSVTTINGYAFRECENLALLTLGNNVASIEGFAFWGCHALTSVNIPDNVTSIGMYAFYGCHQLSSINIPDKLISIGNGAFEQTAWYNSQPDGLAYVGKIAYQVFGAVSSVKIKEGTLGVADYAFDKCPYLTSVTIPKSVVAIGKAAFKGCTKLTAVHIMDLTAWCRIDFSEDYDSNPLGKAKHLFLNENEIVDLLIPNNITTIKKNTFCGCTGITSITIPSSVVSIDDAALFCSSLTDIYNYLKSARRAGNASFAQNLFLCENCSQKRLLSFRLASFGVQQPLTP